MISISHLLNIADAYKAATGIEPDNRVSWRVFGDSNKLTALRDGGDITTGRFNQAIRWFDGNWPQDAARPPALEFALRQDMPVVDPQGADEPQNAGAAQ